MAGLTGIGLQPRIKQPGIVGSVPKGASWLATRP
jgi:hypothetical protein